MNDESLNLALESSIEIREISSNKKDNDHAREALALDRFRIEMFHIVTGTIESSKGSHP